MGIVDSITDRLSALAVARAPWVAAWQELADFTLPMAERMPSAYGLGAAANRYDLLTQGPKATERAPKLFDSTSLWALDRLAAGMESLVTPQSEKWHGLGIEDAFHPDPSDEEGEWFERLRDYLFAVRYDAKSGFAVAHQKAMRCVVSLGTAVLYVEEFFGRPGANAPELPVGYRYIPLSECHLACDAYGEVDTNIRRFTMTPRQQVQRFGERCSERVKAMAENPREADRPLEIIHAALPREEAGGLRNSNRNSPFASFYVDSEHRHLIGESGFFEFPFIVYFWQQSDTAAYGESPAMLALADVKTLNAMAKTSLQAAAQQIKPPLAVASDGVMNRPNLNAGAINPGALDDAGNLKIKPIVTVQAPTFAEAIMQQRREAIRESLYINLFQTLIQNPQMTATEAMIRANEKGELLGPAGAKIQHALARLVDRETGIVERKGAYMPDSPLAPPESLAGRGFGVKFTSPLDRLRRQQETIGVSRTLEAIAPLAAAEPSVLDNFDADETARLFADVNGAPRKVLRRREEVDALRKQRAEAQAQANEIEMTRRAGEAAAAVLPAMEGANALVGNGQPAVLAR